MAGNDHLPIAVVDAKLVGRRCVELVQNHLRRLHQLSPHSQRTLTYDRLLVTLLVGFHETCDRTLRLMEDLSQSQDAAALLGDHRSARSTMSDALAAFDPKALMPLVKDLQARLPALGRMDGDLAEILQRMRIADGSIFTVPSDVAHAIAVSRSNREPGRQLRFNLQLDFVRGIPADFSISGDDDGSETAAFARDLAAGMIYVADRNFMDFKFIRAVIEIKSWFVIRAKIANSSLKFEPAEELELTGKDREADVQSDRIGHLPGCRASPGMQQTLMREVLVLDRRSNKVVRLITNLLDVPAWVIAQLYRRRWEIELFFRWYKCVAKFEHLFSHSKNGIEIQFYTAVIMILLSYIQTGQKPGKYEFHCLGWVARGNMSVETMQVVLARRQRERAQDKARYKTRRAAELSALKTKSQA